MHNKNYSAKVMHVKKAARGGETINNTYINVITKNNIADTVHTKQERIRHAKTLMGRALFKRQQP